MRSVPLSRAARRPMATRRRLAPAPTPAWRAPRGGALVFGLVLLLVVVLVDRLPAFAAPLDLEAPDVPLTAGYQRLLDTAPDVVGVPLEAEHPGDLPDSTVVATTTGLLYWQPGLAPTWTGAGTRLTLDPDAAPIMWVGEDLAPPPPPPAPPALDGGTALNPALEARLDCIAYYESGNRAAAVNPRSGAAGPYQFLWSTWATTPQGRAGLSPHDPVAARDGARWLATHVGFSQWEVVTRGYC